LQNAWKKYGENNFDFQIIEECMKNKKTVGLCDEDKIQEHININLEMIELLKTKSINACFDIITKKYLGYNYNDNIKDFIMIIVLLQFIYYIIPELQKTFITNGSTISWLNKTNIRKFNIPIPKSSEKIKEWVDKISAPYNEKNTKQSQIKELEIFVQNRIKEIGENEWIKPITVIVYNVCI
jgi:hypothetical protein